MPSQSESSLQAGLAALKQGDYQKAKTILEALVNQGDGQSAIIQAKIGLIVTYSRIGEIETAIALSEALSKSSNQKIKVWANDSLTKLRKIKSKQDTLAGEVPEFIPLSNSEDISEDTNISQNQSGQLAASQKLLQQSSQKRRYSEINDKKNHANSSKFTRANSSLIEWRQAGRAKTWQRSGKTNLIPLWLLCLGTLTTLFWVAQIILNILMANVNSILVKLPFVDPLQVLYQDSFYFLVYLFTILLVASPWLLDLIFKKFYQTRPFSIQNLNNYSPEAVRLLQRYYKQRKWKFLKLYIINNPAPIVFTYGNLPRNSRVVVSRGLLEQLKDDEIATIYALQLAHISNRDNIVMSVLLIATIPIYGIYKQLSQWADHISNKIGRSMLGIIANIFYLTWRLLITTGALLSQIRLYYGDRFGTEVTGNPNGAIRALLKVIMGIASDIAKREETSWQLESLNPSLPVGYKQSIAYGSGVPFLSWESLLMWDCTNRYRWFFAALGTHPMLGDRVKHLCTMALNWHLQPELDINTQLVSKQYSKLFFIGVAPFLGILFGLLIGIFLWLIWQIGFAFHLWNLKWIYDDWYFLLGCMLIGFSFGTLIRINYLFPQINPVTIQTNENFSNLIASPNALPIDSSPLQITGKVIGRQGTSNYLAQDLMLNTNIGLIKLHHISWFVKAVNPQDFIGRQVTIYGWLRRGNHIYLDINTLYTHTGQSISIPHPMWSTILSVMTTAFGAYILLNG
ncbi:MAG: M48 family metalloprotease [Mastigocoleus sp.]